MGLPCGGRIRVFVEPARPERAVEHRRGARRARSGSRRVLELGEGERFHLVLEPPVRLVVVGAVHLAQPLARMARVAGYDVTVVDPRPAFATDERFPGVALERGWPAEAVPRIGLDARTAVVALSHDPELDDPALAAALRSDGLLRGRARQPEDAGGAARRGCERRGSPTPTSIDPRTGGARSRRA